LLQHADWAGAYLYAKWSTFLSLVLVLFGQC
jgi:hypothetical protein